MKRYLSCFLLLLLLFCTACSSQSANTGEHTAEDSTPTSGIVENTPENPDISRETEETPPPAEEILPPPDPKTVEIEDILSQMTLAEKVGQMFFVRCPGANQTELVAQYHLGGYLLFGRDFKDGEDNWLTRQQFTDNIKSYQAASQIPLLLGVDEEGGTVARATRNPNLFSEKRPSPQKVFAAGGMDGIRQDAYDVSNMLLENGINVNFAPVADVSTDPNDFIYDRAFGQDAETTAIYITYALMGANSSQVHVTDEARPRQMGSVLKHFPGYGSNVDTHTGIALDNRPYEQFLAEDFLPFRAGIENGAGSVLVSHNIVSCMDADLPASLSPAVHKVLREELGFEGVILTDDLAMDAVEAYAEDGSVAVLAVQAGNDMIVTTDFETQIPQVIAAVEDGTISEDTINAAVTRILSWKYDLGLIGNK